MVEKTDSRNASSKVKAESKKSPPQRGRWFARFLAVVLLIGMIGWFAPGIIASTGLRNSLATGLLRGTPGSIEMGEASLGWLSPVVIKNLKIVDPDGRATVEVKQLSTTSTLLGLILQPNNLGTFKLSEPVLRVALTDQDSHVEQLLKGPDGDKPVDKKPIPAVTVEIDRGRIELEHVASKTQSSIDQIGLRAVTSRSGLEELNLMIGDGPVGKGDESKTDWIAVWFGSPGQNGEAENTALQGDASPAANAATSTDGSAKKVALRAAGWKLDRLKPLLLRFVPNSNLNGELSSNATVALSTGKAGLNWDWGGTVSIKKLMLDIQNEVLREPLLLDQVKFDGRAMAVDGRLALKDLKVTSDVGEVSATGDLSQDVQQQKVAGDLLRTLLSDEDYHLHGHFDLKKLAALMPRTLRVRDGIEITSGDVKMEFVGVDAEGQRRWSGTSEIAGLNAISNGRKISWEQPIAARLNAHRDHDALIVDVLECKSDFLQLMGKGTLEDAKFTVNGDLAKLAQNLAQFVDLGLEQMSGTLTGSGEIKRTDAEHVSLSSKILLNNFAYVVSADNTWHEQHLELTATANGQTDARPMVTRIDTGEIHLVSGTDKFDFVLQQPVDLKSETSAYALNVQMHGGLATWQNRLRPFVASDKWKLFGNVEVVATVTGDANQIAVSQLKAGVKELSAATEGWMIKDTEVNLEASGRWDRQAKKLTSPKLSLVGQSLSVDLSDLDCSIGEKGLAKLTGSVVYRADLKQLSSWHNLAIPNPSNYLIGSLSGTAKVTQQDQKLTGEIDAQVEKMVLAGLDTGPNGALQWVSLWKEPRFQLKGSGSYDQVGDLLTLESSQVGVEGFSMGAKGTLAECSTNRRIDLNGNLNYDWDMLTHRFGPQTAAEVQVTGKDQRAFHFKGTLAKLGTATNATPAGPAGAPPVPADELPDFVGEAGLGWSMASVYGLKIGAGDVSMKIDQGVCRFAPINLPVNDGRIHATPVLYLNRNPMTFVLPGDKFLDQISLSRDLCHNWMQYVAPMLADAAQVEGKVSLDLQETTIPLGMMAAGNGAGTLTIHGAQARPGALTMQLVGPINQLRSLIGRQQVNPNFEQAWVEMPEQHVPVKLEQGRMYHDGLTFVMANITMRTRGSVGLDTTLDMVAQIPFKDEWLGNKPGLNALKGKSIDIPITGTVSRPQVDPKAVGRLAKELGGSMLDDLLQDKVPPGVNSIINNGLDKLLKGKR